MSYEVSLNGDRVVSGSVEIPAYGLWAADVMMADDAQLPASGPLILGDLTMQSYAYRTYAYAGTRKSRLVGGFAGGWMRSVAAQQYANSQGLTLSLVLGDLATANGERVKVASDQTFGQFFFRKGAGPSKKVLDQIVGRSAWWVDPTSGVVQVGATRNAAIISSAFTVNEYDGSTGRAVVSTENPSDWMPGRTWSAPQVPDVQTIASVRHAIVDGKLRTEVLSNTPDPDRLVGPLRELVEDLAPDTTYAGLWEYAVQNVNGGTIDALATTESVLAAPFSLPQHVTGVPMRAGIAGIACKPAVGSMCYVAFANGDPSKPVIVAFDTTTAQSITMQAGTQSAAREGDSVNAGYIVLTSAGSVAAAVGAQGYFPGTAIGLAAATLAASGLTPPGTVLPMVSGQVTSGSSTVRIG
jgi:hypothetical protein